MGGTVYAFGPFELDATAKRLAQGGTTVPISARHLDVLVALVARAGTVLSKDALVEAGWREVAVTDNSLEQAISALRRVLGSTGSGEPYIQTVPRQGYRFVGAVERRAARVEDHVLDELVAPHRAWVEGRAALETLSADRIARARGAFERLVESTPDDPLAHIGLANACAMRYESTRADETPDRAALAHAASHAREACRLSPQSGEACATHGFVLDRMGRSEEARAALVRATTLEADNWRHHFRLALVSWGEERLREARRTLALLPGLPLAHFLAATVLVARQTLSEAERELLAGLESMPVSPEKFPGVGLEWLLGLVQLTRGAEAEALDRFHRELAREDRHLLYTRECCAHAWYAIGAVHLRRQRYADAAGAFEQALTRLPLHAARAVLASLPHHAAGTVTHRRMVAQAPRRDFERGAPSIDAALAQAAALVAAGEPTTAAAVVGQAFSLAPPGSQGWWLPVEPILRVSTTPELWASALAQLRSRAA